MGGLPGTIREGGKGGSMTIARLGNVSGIRLCWTDQQAN
jgi:hypothetical protein